MVKMLKKIINAKNHSNILLEAKYCNNNILWGVW